MTSVTTKKAKLTHWLVNLDTGPVHSFMSQLVQGLDMSVEVSVMDQLFTVYPRKSMKQPPRITPGDHNVPYKEVKRGFQWTPSWSYVMMEPPSCRCHLLLGAG